ncbi:MAG: pyridoxal phosphate-dependent aminotransferase [Dehalococcoidia bacterium]|nr:pyridoxal phosphate-dependent aminotransferase [Dehalococcoidia bacterium]
MTLPDRVRSVVMPPIDALNTRMAELLAQGCDVTSLGQSVPFFGPPEEMLDAVSERLRSSPRIHVYGPDAGIPELREALSDKLARFNGIAADPVSQIMITPGSNQAFMVAMLTLLNPGDEVAIAAPYYFNHHMAIELAGGRVVEIPLSEEDGFQMHLSDIEQVITSRTKSIVVTSPNNPTGTVYNPAEIERIAKFAADREIYLISDEAYETFCFEDSAPFSPGSISEIADNIITLGSFSKTFGMTGWRVGYIVGNSEFLRQAVKVQDATAICAAIVSQVAATAALEVFDTFTLSHSQELEDRRSLLAETIDAIPALNWEHTNGALFAFVRSDFKPTKRELSWDILETSGVLTVPGSAFGEKWSNYLRISYGCSPRERYESALDKLRGYFKIAESK